MKVTFFSNYLNHHQLPFCRAMDRLTAGQFIFVATEPVSALRKQLGYPDMDGQYPFVLAAYDGAANRARAEKLALDSDVVIIGSAHDRYIIDRLRRRKLTFRYSERYYKQGLNLLSFWKKAAGAWIRDGRFQRYPLHMLCAGGYTAADCSIFGNYRNRAYKWGYFPEVREQPLEHLFARKRENRRTSILWAGRLIDWKHPGDAVRIAQKLRENGYAFDLNIIGSGELHDQLRKMIRESGLDGCVRMPGPVTPNEVRAYMDAADVFLFTSDFNEGWGAVLNEAMNSACAVVASHAIGSVPFLLEDGQNGFIYRNGDLDGLYSRVAKLIDQPELREWLGCNAYHTLVKLWNADVAAERLLSLAQALLDGQAVELFHDGPCSRAGILKNGWYKGE